MVKPKNNKPKPSIAWPINLNLFLRANRYKIIPTPIAGKANSEILNAIIWAVIVVPIFAPITIGIAVSNVRPVPVAEPAATRPTMIDVVVDDDWITAVARIPIINPTRGFEVVWKMALAKSAPKSLKAAPKRVIDRINRYSKKKIRMIFAAMM